MYLQETHIKYKDREKLKEKEWKELYCAYSNQKSSHSYHIRQKRLQRISPRIKEGHFIMLKEVLYHEYITILIFYPSSNGFKIHKVETDIIKMTNSLRGRST